MFDYRVNAAVPRWISVIFLQGEEADELLELIDHRGPAAAITHLQQWDHGDETLDAALSNGYVYDRIPAGQTDRTVESARSPYALTYSAQFGYVSLLRRYDADAEPAPSFSLMPATTPPPHGHHDVSDTWASSRRATIQAGHTVAL